MCVYLHRLFTKSFNYMLPTTTKKAQDAENQIVNMTMHDIEIIDEETGEITTLFITGNETDGFNPAFIDHRKWQDTGNLLNYYPFINKEGRITRPLFVGWFVSEALDKDGNVLVKLSSNKKPYPSYIVQEYQSNIKYLIPQWEILNSLPDFTDKELLILNYLGNSKDSSGKIKFHSIRIMKYDGVITRPNGTPIPEKKAKGTNASKAAIKGKK